MDLDATLIRNFFFAQENHCREYCVILSFRTQNPLYLVTLLMMKLVWGGAQVCEHSPSVISSSTDIRPDGHTVYP